MNEKVKKNPKIPPVDVISVPPNWKYKSPQIEIWKL